MYPTLRHKFSLGPKLVYIPLLIISIMIIVSAIANFTTLKDFGGTTFMAVFLFTFYLIGRIVGKEIFKPFAWVVVIESVSVVVYSLIIKYGFQNGGVQSLTNYNIATALLVFGSIVAVINRQWILVGIASVGLFFTGSEEGLVAFAIMFVVFLIRKDFSRRLWFIVAVLTIIAIIGFVPFTYTQSLYANPINNVNQLIFHTDSPLVEQYYHNDPSKFGSTADYILRDRYTLDKMGWNLSLIGTGYVLEPLWTVPTNSPLIVVYQIGIIGAILWTFLTFYGLFKTKWRYAFIVIIGLSLTDNYFWAQLGIWWFTLLGVSTLPELKSDLIFKKL